MTSASSLHFGPEWMRKPSRGSLAPLSPNPAGNSPSTTSNMLPTPPTQAAPALPNVSSYSSLLTSSSPPPEIKSEDESYPFRYSKDQMIRVWKDGGGRGGLGLEVERWPGIVREVGGEPVGIKDMTQEERKLFSMPVNSDPPIRRNNSSLSLAPDRQSSKFGQGIGIGLGPASPRGMGAPRRRGTGNADDPTTMPFLPRKLSVSSTLLAGGGANGTPGSPVGALPSPNTRTRFSGLDGSDAAEPWSRGATTGGAADSGWSAMGARRRVSEGRGWGNPAGTPTGTGLGIGRGMSFGSLANGTTSGNGSVDEKISPSVSPGPPAASDADAFVPAIENGAGQIPEPAGTGSLTGIEVPQATSITNMIYTTNGPSFIAPAIAPEPTEDFANLQWSYKDPTGQIQGPFVGATMQQWLEGGYFSDDLLIKRTSIDSEFEPLREVRRRAPPLRPGELHVKMFLSPLAPRAPPNLPLPQAQLLGNNTPPNPSPRLAHLMTGMLDPSTHGPMSAGVGGSPLANSPALSAARSTTLDSYLNPALAPGSVPSEGPVAGTVAIAALTNAAIERKKREDFIQSLRERELAMGVGSPNPQPTNLSGPFGAGFIPNPTVHHPQYSAFPSNNPVLSSPFGSRLNMPIPPTPIHAPVNNSTLGVISPFPHNGPVLWSSGEQMNTPSSYNASPSGFDHGTIYQSAPGQQQQGETWQDFAPQEPTWETAEQYDLPPAVEAALNVAEDSLQTPITDSGVHDSPSSAQQSLPGENDRAVENIATALEQARIEEEPSMPSEMVPEFAAVESNWLPSTAPAEVTPAPLNKRKNTNASSKGKTAPAAVAIHPKETVAPSTPSPVSPPAPSKAWATPDDDKPSSMSLREIQEVEARRAEARKAAEKVAKAVPLPSNTSDESIQAVTGSWGLPQVGTRPAAPVSTPSTNGAAWTKPAAVPTGKKTMKEIQEEEEKRKKAAATKEAQSIAAAQLASKRAYAESAKNVAAPAGGVWTTVGTQGKPGAPPAAVRQPSLAQAAPAVRAVPGASTAPRPSSSASTTQPSTKPAKATAPEDAPVPPSLDFLKWLKEALKGLNGINVEEFMQMLLSFPLDPSPAVIEIISDSIYANSSTLDGRRFAAEFCQKRKADAAAARSKAGSASGAKAPRVSLADVVKTQPKPVQAEWGFKTVQKKAKGGRK
ncbi:hypothetical protein BDV93DRAFT_517414 [Ceratobasidium sp. AG-I]|nr:hypothetical protein BDV93DRAFT_517414 [Ceratobasidium sp. AG-I]